MVAEDLWSHVFSMGSTEQWFSQSHPQAQVKAPSITCTILWNENCQHKHGGRNRGAAWPRAASPAVGELSGLSVTARRFSGKPSFGKQFPFSFYVFSGLSDPWVFWGKHGPYGSDLLTLNLPEVSFVKSILRLGNLFSLFLNAVYPGSSHSKGSRELKQLLGYNWGQKTLSAFVTWAFLGQGEARRPLL